MPTNLIKGLGLLLVSASTMSALHAGELDVSSIARVNEKKRIIPIPVAVDAKFKNTEWPAEWEDGLRTRVDQMIRSVGKRKVGVNTYFENEKHTYGLAMIKVLTGDAKALSSLQGKDAQAGSWHKHTLGIDWYACFTIKHQIRKYFLFGKLLKPDYKKQMFDSAKIWTEEDPLRRPHHEFKRGQQGWGPNAKNSWVDVRNTDNLFMMRVTSVYLMAETTGNKAVAEIYKKRFATYVRALYRIGMGEWDSENYMGHTIAPVFNIYDFAQDPEMKLLAKAALDWFYAAGAVKYWRGGFNVPNKRDYNKPGPMHCSAAFLMYPYFGDTPKPHEHLESDELYPITSSYRPPIAVMKLAMRKFERPLELFSAKANYNAPRKGQMDSRPAYFETDYYTPTCQFGTIAQGASDGGDVGAWKVMTWNSSAGVDYVQCVPGPDPKACGSAKYGRQKVSGSNRIAQYRNVSIWVVKNGTSPWLWVMPRTIPAEVEKDIMFFKAEKTWMAVYPINLSLKGIDEEKTAQIQFKQKKTRVRKGPDKGKWVVQKKPHWASHHVALGEGKGGTYCGFAFELGEEASHGDYEAFKKACKDKAVVDASKLDEGTVAFRCSQGKALGFTFGTGFSSFAVKRDGKSHDWAKHVVMYRNATGKTAPISQAWGGPKLAVECGGATFTCTVGDDNKVTFENK